MENIFIPFYTGVLIYIKVYKKKLKVCTTVLPVVDTRILLLPDKNLAVSKW